MEESRSVAYFEGDLPVSLFLLGTILLMLSFGVHIVLWRLVIRDRRILTLLAIFAITPVLVILAGIATSTLPALDEFSMESTFRVALFYGAFSLVYVVIYSGLESESPTLAIISYIASRGDAGCIDRELSDHIMTDDGIGSRVDLMETSGLINLKSGMCTLTPKGHFFAALFEFAARFFRLPLGG